jgi:hypothetical protein
LLPLASRQIRTIPPCPREAPFIYRKTPPVARENHPGIVGGAAQKPVPECTLYIAYRPAKHNRAKSPAGGKAVDDQMVIGYYQALTFFIEKIR